MASLADDLTKATTAADKALRDAEAQAARLAEVRDLLAKVPAAEQELSQLARSIRDAKKDLEKVQGDIAIAKERYEAAKAETRKARQDADASIAEDAERYRQAHEAHDAAMKGLSDSLEQTKDYVEREQTAALAKLKPIADLMTQFHQQREEWQRRLAG